MADVPIPDAERMVDPGALEALQSRDVQGLDNPRLRNDGNAVEALIAGTPTIWTLIHADTARIFLAALKLLPGQVSGKVVAPFDMIYFAEMGGLVVSPESSGREFRVETGDVVFIPADEPHRLSNHAARSSRTLMAGAGSFAGVDTRGR